MPAVQARLAARVEMANMNAGVADPVVLERSKLALTMWAVAKRTATDRANRDCLMASPMTTMALK